MRSGDASGSTMIRLLTPADYCSMPWKNGGGRTTEIATHPPGAALDAFVWRASIADVGRDGPFSPFPGVDRAIVLLEGAGMRLTGDDRDVELRKPFEPLRFSGDESIECTLIAGPVRDFNAMFRRGAASGSIAVVRGSGAAVAPSDFRLAYAAAGAHECAMPDRPPFVLEPGHTVLVERWASVDAAPLAIAPLAAGAVALVVSVECR
jgi:environmental stress-induced protein Ves